jgi:hypothetical protein
MFGSRNNFLLKRLCIGIPEFVRNMWDKAEIIKARVTLYVFWSTTGTVRSMTNLITVDHRVIRALVRY